MSLVSSIVTAIRVEIDDVGQTRFTDDTTTILPLIKKALRRTENIAIRNGLEFAKSSATSTVLEDATTTALPSDFKQDIGLFYNYKEIKKLDTFNFETTRYGDYWRINGSNIELLEAVSEDTDFTLWYYPIIDFSSYTTASTMPWSGKLDDIITDYVVLILKNLDEYEITTDAALVKELEQMILSVYKPQTPLLQQREGYLP